jgi:hypothetical protein
MRRASHSLGAPPWTYWIKLGLRTIGECTYTKTNRHMTDRNKPSRRTVGGGTPRQAHFMDDHYCSARAFAVNPARLKRRAPWAGLRGLTAQRGQARGLSCQECRQVLPREQLNLVRDAPWRRPVVDCGKSSRNPLTRWTSYKRRGRVTRVGIDRSTGNWRSPRCRRKTAVFSGWHEPDMSRGLSPVL